MARRSSSGIQMTIKTDGWMSLSSRAPLGPQSPYGSMPTCARSRLDIPKPLQIDAQLIVGDLYEVKGVAGLVGSSSTIGSRWIFSRGSLTDRQKSRRPAGQASGLIQVTWTVHRSD